MKDIPTIVCENDIDSFNTLKEYLSQGGFKMVGAAHNLHDSLKLVEQKGRKARVALVDQSLEDDNDSYDFSGREVIEKLSKINPTVVIASISGRDFPGTEIARKNYSGTAAFLQALAQLVNK